MGRRRLGSALLRSGETKKEGRFLRPSFFEASPAQLEHCATIRAILPRRQALVWVRKTLCFEGFSVVRPVPADVPEQQER
jgi:hypothetical protein